MRLSGHVLRAFNSDDNVEGFGNEIVFQRIAEEKFDFGAAGCRRLRVLVLSFRNGDSGSDCAEIAVQSERSGAVAAADIADAVAGPDRNFLSDQTSQIVDSVFSGFCRLVQ
jgi:hypothetical protein